MESDAISPSPLPPVRGLPPVTPPSGRFIAQLFLVPGAIVFFAVLLLMMFHNLLGGSQTPPEILRQLDSGNPDIRWRAASDLATTLEKSESLALRSDPEFALELVKRLRQAIAEADARTLAGNLSEDKRASAEADKQENYLNFLTVAVARLNIPLAIPVLCEVVQRADRPDDARFVHMRRQALLALTILGDNVQNFSKLSEEQRTKILEGLEQLTSKEPVLARTALYYLDEPRLNRNTSAAADVVHIDRALKKCAEADDPFARGMVAWCLRFWKGDLVEPTLKKLANDDGHGRLLKK
jgi:hypothetical protein